MSNTYKWIRENDDQSSEIEYQEPLELAFPTGPYEASRRMIDIVVVTPESVSQSNPQTWISPLHCCRSHGFRWRRGWHLDPYERLVFRSLLPPRTDFPQLDLD